MIPIRDTIPSPRISWVTRILMLANVLIFAIELQQGAHLNAFLYRFGVVPLQWRISSLSDLLDWPRLCMTLVTSQFLHSGFLHLGANLVYLWIFAKTVEGRLGHKQFSILYVGSGVSACVVHLAMSSGSAVPMIGASGAIAGILGAYLLMFPSAHIVMSVPIGWPWRTVEIPAILFLGIWFLLQWVRALTSIGQITGSSGVAFWAHIGGFIAGVLAVTVCGLARRRG